MVDKIDKFREKLAELMNEADPYGRIDKMSGYANGVLTFYQSLGPLLRNGTLGTYACPVCQDRTAARKTSSFVGTSGLAGLRYICVSEWLDYDQKKHHKTIKAAR